MSKRLLRDQHNALFLRNGRQFLKPLVQEHSTQGQVPRSLCATRAGNDPHGGHRVEGDWLGVETAARRRTAIHAVQRARRMGRDVGVGGEGLGGSTDAAVTTAP